MINTEWKQPIATHARPACPNLAFKPRRIPSHRTKFDIDWEKAEEVVSELGKGVLVAAIPIAFLVLSAMWWMCLI